MRKQLLLTLVVVLASVDHDADLGLQAAQLESEMTKTMTGMSTTNILVRRPSFRPLGRPSTRFRAQSTRFALLWVTPTTAIAQGRSQVVAARSTGTAVATILPLPRLLRSTSS